MSDQRHEATIRSLDDIQARCRLTGDDAIIERLDDILAPKTKWPARREDIAALAKFARRVIADRMYLPESEQPHAYELAVEGLANALGVEGDT
jgi:hypothetical protein